MNREPKTPHPLAVEAFGRVAAAVHQAIDLAEGMARAEERERCAQVAEGMAARIERSAPGEDPDVDSVALSRTLRGLAEAIRFPEKRGI